MSYAGLLHLDLGCAGQLREPNSPETADLGAQLLDLGGLALDDDDLEAVVMIEVHVGGADRLYVVAMLGVHDAVHQITLMVVVDDGEDSHDGFATCVPLLDDELLADQVPDKLRSGGVSAGDDPRVEFIEQFL